MDFVKRPGSFIVINAILLRRQRRILSLEFPRHFEHLGRDK
jgi:hypothetical protein